MTVKKGRCKICSGYFPLDNDGRLVAHRHLKTRNRCRGQWPGTDGKHTVGRDSDRWVASAGLPTLGRRP